MTTYRFRVKYEPDPSRLWRDIVTGANRSLAEFQTVLNRAMGLQRDHLWFFGTDQDYWRSTIQYKHPGEVAQSSGGLMQSGEEYDAAETTIEQMAQQLDLDEGGRICYLFDYGDEWRFYAILKEINANESSDTSPTVVQRQGDPIDQYS